MMTPDLHTRFFFFHAAQMVTQFAQTEQNMNAVERVIVYAELPAEGARTTSDDPPPAWPSKGAVAFRNVGLAYREGLPLVLKDVSFEIRAGEKVGWGPFGLFLSFVGFTMCTCWTGRRCWSDRSRWAALFICLALAVMECLVFRQKLVIASVVQVSPPTPPWRNACG